jgi:hypothetical protein
MTVEDGPGKLGGFTKSGELVQPKASAYYGSSARRARLAGAAGTADGKMSIGKGSRVNHLTARPRALSRFNSLAMYNAAENTAHYSPFQVLAKASGGRAVKNEAFRKAVYGADATVDSLKGEQVFQRGMISMITAGRRTDVLERKAANGSGRAARKLATAQTQVGRLANMNNPFSVVKGSTNYTTSVVRGSTNYAATSTLSPRRLQALQNMANLGTGPEAARAAEVLARSTTQTAVSSNISYARNAVSTNVSYKGLGASGVESALAGGNKVGLTGNLMASAGANQGSRFVQGYFRGALGHMNAGGLTDDALRGAQRAVGHLGAALGEQGLKRSGVAVAEKALEQGVFKTLGLKRTMQAAGTKQGAMVLGARTAAMAIPGLNLIATASLVYDLGKMGGELVKSGVNLARDAVKSMKGSIDKPMFGMGYKDNEVAATSRSRGVMAIQNSRLNARSMLGSEGSMMAAHFG